MRYRSMLGLAALSVAFYTACGSHSGPAGSAGAKVLRDQYEPLTPIPATGGIAQITFNADGTYFLKRALDASTDPDELVVPETGAYAVDVDKNVLTLTPRGGAPEKHAFEVRLTSTDAQAAGIRTQDFTSVLTFIVSFVLDGLLFHTDNPATPDNGQVDDASWPKPSETPSAAGCTAPAPTFSGDGIDVSHWQGSVDWTAVKKSYAYAKATEGDRYRDPTFVANWKAMGAAGVKRGAYHFFRASKDATKQADKFVSVLQASGFDAKLDLPPVVDIEVLDGKSAEDVVSGAREFIKQAESKLGVKLLVYTYGLFWRDNLKNPDFSANALWIAHYTSQAQPSIPSTWKSHVLWQFSQTTEVAGVTGNVDGDRAPASSAATDGGVTDGGAACAAPPTDASTPFDASSSDAFDASVIPGTCTHDVCTAGEALGQACNACTQIVCANDPYCCQTYWGLSCFPDVAKYCGMTCK